VNPTSTFWRRLWGQRILESSNFLYILQARNRISTRSSKKLGEHLSSCKLLAWESEILESLT